VIDGLVPKETGGEAMKISVIYPDVGDANSLDKSLESVRAQDHPDLEVIRAEGDSIESAWNEGLASATGEFVQFLDPRDRLLAGKISHQVRRIEKCRRMPTLVAADYFRRTRLGGRSRVPLVSSDPWVGLLRGSLGSASANVFATAPARAVGGWDPSMGGDGECDFLFRLLANGGGVCLDRQPLTLVRDRESSRAARRARAPENRARSLEIRARIGAHLKSLGMLSGDRLEALHASISRAVETVPAGA
jgi:glycosyltransferase involved in cell wall biosynthesis